ncbi:GntR family transcriptional regulator [Leifsonia aquatica]|uniref:GntR family transcriptional regulator n=1 Tax=Leifsonia aquatica TaxID=144185 RepID=UPI003805EBA6
MRDQLRDAIMDGVLLPGEVLRDAELTAWLDVSRSPLRSALDDLAREGLIELAPSRYTRVAVPREDQIVPAMHALGILRSGAIWFGLPRLDSATRARLQEMCTAFAIALRARDDDGMRRYFFPIFDLVIEHVENELYRGHLVSSVATIRFRTRVAAVSSLIGADGMDRVADAADALGEAIAAGDVAAAREATETLHLGWIAE